MASMAGVGMGYPTRQAGGATGGADGGGPSLTIQWGNQEPGRRWSTRPSCRAFGFAPGLAGGGKPRGDGSSRLDGGGAGAGGGGGLSQEERRP